MRFLALFVMFFCAGCTDLLKSARINPQTVAIYPGGENPEKTKKGCEFTQAIGDSNDGSINIDCFRFPEDVKVNGKELHFIGVPAYDLAAGRQNKFYKQQDAENDQTDTAVTDAQWESARMYRNRLAAILTKQADDVCTVEKGRLVRSETGVNFLLSFLTTSLSGAASIVSGEKTKSILAGLATTSSGTQSNFNATFYKNQLTQAISKSMDTERSRLLSLIVGAQGQPPQSYSVDDMIRQVNQYYQACSFEHGLQLLLDKALDSSGANAALETRANRAAINALSSYLSTLEGKAQKADGSADEQIVAQITEVRNKIQTLTLADAQLRTTQPNAAQTSEVEPPSAPPKNPLTDNPGQADVKTP